MFAHIQRAIPLRIALSYLIATASARVMWIPEEFDPYAGRNLHTKRDSATCSSNPSLNQCPSEFPPNFCCSPGTTCLSINTGNSSVTSAICCPDGQDCTTIHPVACKESLQDANTFPGSQLHSIPPQPLDTCGTGCCPMGYSCNSANVCIAQTAPSTGTTAGSSTTSGGTTTSSSGNTAAPTTAQSHVGGSATHSSGPTFNGKSFAAGFIPGIAIGIILAALLVFLCLKRKHKEPETYVEKNRDTLTDLGTLRPNTHGRSISEPTVDPRYGTRTDFLRSSPPRTADSNDIINGTYNVEATGPKTPVSRTPKMKALFSRSPFMNQTPSTPPLTQPPMPAHMKRGTLSFTISPIRGLRKQKSMHSLRRQMADSARYPGDPSRTESTETIQVLMPNNDPYTPDQRTIPEESRTLGSAKYQPPHSAGTWNDSPVAKPTQYASSSRYPSEQPQMTMPSPPPPLPIHANGDLSFLDSPYTPTKSQGRGGLMVPDSSTSPRRDTTFSALMEKAGLRKSDLVMGTRKKADAKYGL